MMTTRPSSRAPLVLLLVCAAFVVGCASGGSGSAPAVGGDAAPAAPAKKAFEPPAWESKVFENAEHAFSVHYPSDFAESPPTNGGLFSAASPSQVPRLDVLVLPVPPSTPLDQIGAALADNMKQVGGGEAEVTSSKATTLQDGVTEGMEFTLSWTFQGFPLDSIILGAPSPTGNGIIGVMVTGMQGGDMEQLRDIASTLYFD